MAEFDISLGVGLEVTQSIVKERITDGRRTTEVGLRVEVPDGGVSYGFDTESLTGPTTELVVDSLTRAVEESPEEVLRERLNSGPKRERINRLQGNIIKEANRKAKLMVGGSSYFYGLISGGGGVIAAMNLPEHHYQYGAVGLAFMALGAVAFGAVSLGSVNVLDEGAFPDLKRDCQELGVLEAVQKAISNIPKPEEAELQSVT